MTKFTAEFQTCPFLELKNMVLKYAMEIDISDKRRRNKIFDFLYEKIKNEANVDFFSVKQILILKKKKVKKL